MRLDPTRILSQLRATYWFVPSCMVAIAIVLAFVMPWVDERYSIDPSGSFGWLGQTQTDGARAVLGAIAGSIIGVAGTTFSITMVAVSFASANFGPRLIANFMRDRGNQITLGTFIATFVYCLLVLRRVHNAAGDGGDISYGAFVPHFSVIVALTLALASVGVLIYFIHHVPETINIDRLVAQIGHELRRGVTELFPDTDAIDDENAAETIALAWRERIDDRPALSVCAAASGFVQRIDLKRLAELTDAHALLVRVQYRPGDFVTEGDIAFEVWHQDPPTVQERHAASLEKTLRATLHDCLETGYQRTPHQNCLFLVEQLVEVIGRAMSPGINDPFTAITCLNWLKGALVEFVERDARPSQPPRDAAVRVHPITFERLVATAFDQTRQYVCSDRDVAMHAMTVLAEIAVRTSDADHRDTLRRRMDALRTASATALAAEVGGDDVARRHADAARLLDDPQARRSHRDGPGWFGGSG